MQIGKADTVSTHQNSLMCYSVWTPWTSRHHIRMESFYCSDFGLFRCLSQYFYCPYFISNVCDTEFLWYQFRMSKDSFIWTYDFSQRLFNIKQREVGNRKREKNSIEMKYINSVSKGNKMINWFSVENRSVVQNQNSCGQRQMEMKRLTPHKLWVLLMSHCGFHQIAWQSWKHCTLKNLKSKTKPNVMTYLFLSDG